MPYITQEARIRLASGGPPKTTGELNYLISLLLAQYVERNGLSYSTINDVMGAISGAKEEFYQRVAAPYEYNKRMENGDIY